MMADSEKVLSWAMVLGYVLLNSAGALAIKEAVQRAGVFETGTIRGVATFLSSMLLSPLVILGFLSIGLSACAWIVALSRLDLSVAYPVAVALNCAIVVAAGFAVYGESFTLVRLLGLILLMPGVYLLFRAS